MKATSGEEVETGDMPGPLLGASDEYRQPHPVPCQPAPFPGISILDKLIRTCPVWLQLNTRKERVAEILCMEPRGAFMVRKDCTLTNMVLSANFPGAEGTANILEYSIKEENSIMYLDGSLLVFEDIFKMVAFYCVSRDILPSPLTLPQVIAEATNPDELEVVSHLGIDFWNSYMNRGNREGSLKVSKDLNVINRQTQSLASAPHLSTDKSACSCEIELSAGNDKLWFVNPVFIKEYCSTAHSPGPPLERTSSHASNRDLKVRRPPPLPPRPKLSEVIAVMSDNDRRRNQLLKGEVTKKNTEVCTRKEQESLVEPIKELEKKEIEISTVNTAVQNTDHLPPVPPRRRLVERQPTDTTCDKSEEMAQSNGNTQNDEPADQTCVKSTENKQNLLSEKTTNIDTGLISTTPAGPDAEQKKQTYQQTPVAPPRRKKMARREAEQEGTATGQESKTPTASELNTAKGLSEDASDSSVQSLTSADSQSGQPCNFAELKIADESLYSPECNAVSPSDEIDSYSNSSTEEELDSVNTPSKFKKQRQSMMLNKARNRLSIMTITNVLNAFRSTDRKIMKKITELAQEKASYFGQLIQDYRAYTLEMMGNQTSSTEMLQEIRQMMTQLKSYLLQSTELTLMIDSSNQSEDKLEAILEAALCKCVLKPLKDNINNQLKEIHSKNGNLKLLKENQQIVQNTTTTELGVTTSVPEVSVLEKIQQKLSNMHQAYSPDKKVTYLLKSCKMIYDSMSVGNHEQGLTGQVPQDTLQKMPTSNEEQMLRQAKKDSDGLEEKWGFGKLKKEKRRVEKFGEGTLHSKNSIKISPAYSKSHGADDFLPVLMYVLARSNLTSLLLDVEYMMELLDPSLHLGEGYYYLTTTYGALEHIKHFDKQTVTRQLSHEVQDSIHQWERRRTLNLKQVPRSSVQDFLSVCFLEYGCNIKTFAINPETTAEKLSKQCAEKFGVSESEEYCLHLVVEERSMQLAAIAVPHQLKSILRKMQPQKDHYFVYKQANQTEETENPPIRDLPPL